MRLLLILLLFFSPAFSEAADLFEGKRVSSIDLIVDCPDSSYLFDPSGALARMKTKQGDPFSQALFDNDLKTLAGEYDRVEPSLQIVDDQVRITIYLTPRPIIHSITWEGNEHFSTSKLQKELAVEPKSVFNRQEFNKSFNKVKELYIKESYFESVLSYGVYPIPGTQEVDIVINIQEGRPGIVQQILFQGFTPEEQSDLTDMIYHKKYNFLTSWVTGNGYLRDEMLEQDRMTILNYLHNKGYADAHIDINLQEDPKSGKIIVEIVAHRGTLYRFGTVCVEGNSLISTEDLMNVSLIHEGDPFSADKVRDTSQAMKDLYGHKGYIDASVQYETPLVGDEPIFNVNFTVFEGKEYRVGLIHIFGNSATESRVLLRESLLVPGETFDARKLRATQSRLEAMGYFKSVNVYAVRTADDASLGENYRDVYIEVEEKTTGAIKLFMGFSSLDNVYGGLELTEHNFRAAGIPRILAAQPSAMRGGGEYFHARATLGKKESNYLISWMNPYLYDTPWRLGIELSKTFSKLQTKQNIQTYGGSVFTSYPLSVYWTFGMRQRFRHTNNRISQSVQDSISITEQNQLDQAGLVSAFSVNINYDSTDSAIKPHRGWRSYLEGEVAGIGGNYDFFKSTYTNSIYFPLWAKGTVKLRGDFRYIFPFGKTSNQINIPLSERYFLGGETTLRGYKPFSIGKAIGTSDSPLGGISSTLLSLEYNQQIFRMLDAFIFFDTGSLSTHKLMVKNFKSSAGVGARLDIGNQLPILVGYGYPFNAKDYQYLGFFFSMAGQF